MKNIGFSEMSIIPKSIRFLFSTCFISFNGSSEKTTPTKTIKETKINTKEKEKEEILIYKMATVLQELPIILP